MLQKCVNIPGSSLETSLLLVSAANVEGLNTLSVQKLNRRLERIYIRGKFNISAQSVS